MGNFIKQAEKTAWVAFPERIVNEVELVNEDQEKINNEILAVHRKGLRKAHCHLHGEREHGTPNCEMVKLVELKGWTRNKFKPRKVNK